MTPIPQSNTLDASGHDVTVLLVEDDVLQLIGLADFLRAAGFRLFEAFNAHEAMAVLETTDVDLVFSDVNMPGGMDGLGLATWIRDHRPATPVILTSAMLPARARDASGWTEDDGTFLPKPYGFAEAENVIRRAVAARR